uniref:Disease resistance protein winged helix domain-containing protein n=1 Tax=Leersia perrieri TaxID=77586 RepID=A0A0D9V1S8_9ORYZ
MFNTLLYISKRSYVINMRHLISQWIAHGFILTNQAQQPEDVENGYFDSLLKVGFFDINKKTKHGLVVTIGEVDRKLLDKVCAFYGSRCKLASSKTRNKQHCIHTIILKFIDIYSSHRFVSNLK